MKTCKTIFEEAKPAKEYPADWLVIPALDFGKYIKQNFVPLSEFEAYKQKIEQAMLKIEDEMISKPFNEFTGCKEGFRRLKKELLEL